MIVHPINNIHYTCHRVCENRYNTSKYMIELLHQLKEVSETRDKNDKGTSSTTDIQQLAI